jgi:hypothetical protein
MSKETMQVVETENMEAVEEVKPQGFFSKVKEGIKKHGKTILAVGGAIVGAAGLIAYVTSKGSQEVTPIDYEVVEDLTEEDELEEESVEI